MDARRKAREMESDFNLERVNRFERQELDEYDDEEEEEEMDEGAERALNLEKFECPLREWIAEDRTRREIQKRFRKFLDHYYDGMEKIVDWMKRNNNEGNTQLPVELQSINQNPIYKKAIDTMCAANKASLEVSFSHIAKVQSLLAVWLIDVPKDMLQIFDEVLQSVVLKDYPHYSKVNHHLPYFLTIL